MHFICFLVLPDKYRDNMRYRIKHFFIVCGIVIKSYRSVHDIRMVFVWKHAALYVFIRWFFS